MFFLWFFFTFFCVVLDSATLLHSPFLSRLLWNMSSQKDTPMNASNSSPTSREGSSPIWTMRSRYRKQACVLKRLSLCRKGISTVGWALPAFLPFLLCLGHQLIKNAVEGHRIAVLKSGRQLALLSLLPFCSSDQMRLFGVLFSSLAWALQFPGAQLSFVFLA